MSITWRRRPHASRFSKIYTAIVFFCASLIYTTALDMMGLFRRILLLGVSPLQFLWSAGAITSMHFRNESQPKLLLPVTLLVDEEAVKVTGNQTRAENQMLTAPNLFEGDLLGIPLNISMQNASDQDVHSGRNGSYKWPGGVVPYELSKIFRPADKQVIQDAMKDFMAQTPIKLREKRNSDKDYIYIAPGFGCSSYLGRQTGKQILSLQVPGCMKRGYIQHELMHAIGFYHEQARADRDAYVELNWNNIPRDQSNQFQKYINKEITSYGKPYDFASILHYGMHDFAANDTDWTIRPRPNLTVTSDSVNMGQRNALSRTDREKVRLAYRACPTDDGWGVYRNVCYFFSFLTETPKRNSIGATVFCQLKNADIAAKPKKDVAEFFITQMTSRSSALMGNESVYVDYCRTISRDRWNDTDLSDCMQRLHFICSKVGESETSESTTTEAPAILLVNTTAASPELTTPLPAADPNRTLTIALATALPIAFVVGLGLLGLYCMNNHRRKGDLPENASEEPSAPVITPVPAEPVIIPVVVEPSPEPTRGFQPFQRENWTFTDSG